MRFDEIERAQAHNIASTLLSAKFYNLIIQLAGYFMLKYNKRHFPISFGTNLSHYRISLFLCVSFSTPLWLSCTYIYNVHSYMVPLILIISVFGNDCIFRSIHTRQIDWAVKKNCYGSNDAYTSNVKTVKWNAWVNIDLCICTHTILQK